MTRIVITHVGITALECEAIARRQNVPRDYERELQQIKNNQRRIDRLLPEWSQALQTGLRAIWSDPHRTDRIDQLKKSPAEIASLHLMGLEPGDRVVLVHSDTVAGEFSARLLRECLISKQLPQQVIDQIDLFSAYEAGIRQLVAKIGPSHEAHVVVLTYQQRLTENLQSARLYGDTETFRANRAEIISYLNKLALSALGVSFNELCNLSVSTTKNENALFRATGLDVPDIERLPGVEIDDGKQFLTRGLPFYMQIVANQYDKMRPGDRLFFNITGGYKGIVPFAMLAAQLLGTYPGRSVPVELVYVHEQSQQVTYPTLLLPIDWGGLERLWPDIRILVEHPGTTRARALDDRLKPYVETSGQPNALAVALYHLANELDWFK